MEMKGTSIKQFMKVSTSPFKMNSVEIFDDFKVL